MNKSLNLSVNSLSQHLINLHTKSLENNTCQPLTLDPCKHSESNFLARPLLHPYLNGITVLHVQGLRSVPFVDPRPVERKPDSLDRE